MRNLRAFLSFALDFPCAFTDATFSAYVVRFHMPGVLLPVFVLPQRTRPKLLILPRLLLRVSRCGPFLVAYTPYVALRMPADLLQRSCPALQIVRLGPGRTGDRRGFAL